MSTPIFNYLQKKFSCNIHLALLLRLLIVMLLFVVCRLLFYNFNKELFPGLNYGQWMKILKGGLVFDLAALFYVNSLYILLQLIPFKFRYNLAYQKVAEIIFYVSNAWALVVNGIDIIYYRFSLRRSTLAVFDEFKHEQNKGKFVVEFMSDYWYVTLLFILMIGVMIFVYKRISIKKPARFLTPVLYYPIALAILLGSVALIVGGIRGDFKYSTRPITMSNAGEYVERPSDASLVLNTAFTLIRTSSKTFYKTDTYFTADEVAKIYTPVQEIKATGEFKNYNVVVFILESFGKGGVGYLNRDLSNGTFKGFTPFLDSLLSVGHTSMNTFANGRKSIDALPSVLAGIPAGEVPFILTPYTSNKIKSLPAILKEKGYQTSFFHGAPNGSMGFKAILNLMGVSDYYGKDEFNNDAEFDGLWGIWDEPFFQYFANNLDTMKQPFFSSIFSVSSHHPFALPGKYKNVFPKGDIPILQSMAYTDMALRKFFDNAKTKPWFKNTLFVFTADHATVSNLPQYQTGIGNLAIPILFYMPNGLLPARTDSAIIQQTDIMPSVLGLLNYNGKIVSFGKNIFDSTHKNFAASYSEAFRWIQDDYVLEFSNGRSSGLYNFAKDKLMKKDLQKELPQRKNDMELHLKAFIQQYHNRMLEDKLLP